MNPEDLSPGIRNAVVSLMDAGFDEIAECNDGSTLYSEFMGGSGGAVVDLRNDSFDHTPSISIRVVSRLYLTGTADSILDHFRHLGLNPDIQAHYSPQTGEALVVIVGDCLLNLRYTPKDERSPSWTSGARSSG